MRFAEQIDPGLFAGRTEAEIRGTVDNMVEAMRGGKDRAERDRVLFSFRGMHDALVAAMRMDPELTEAISSNVFNTLSRSIVVDGVMEGYTGVPRIAAELFRLIPTPGKPTGRIARATTDATMEEVQQLEQYKAAGMSDKYVTFENKKFGRHIPLSREAVMEDQTGTVLDTARGVGEVMANYEEKSALNTIQDVAGFVGYNPAGTQTALYSATATESKTQTPAANLVATNALAAWTNVDAAWKKLGSKIGENGDPIGAATRVSILAPWALRGVGGYVLKNSKSTVATINADAPRMLQESLPDGARYSPWLDLQSPTTWYMGDFRRQFVKTSYWDMETTFINGKNEASFQLRDIYGTFLVSSYFDYIATDFRFVIKNTA